MINEEQVFEDVVDASFEFEEDDSIEVVRRNECNFHLRIKRLQSTLSGRLKLVNSFKQLTDNNYVPLTERNINIDSNNEEQIVDFLLKNTAYIESQLSDKVKDWMLTNGSAFQKNRVSKYFKIKG